MSIHRPFLAITTLDHGCKEVDSIQYFIHIGGANRSSQDQAATPKDMTKINDINLVFMHETNTSEDVGMC